MGRILVKNKKRHRPSTGIPNSSVRKRPLEQSNSVLSESSAATEPSSPQLGMTPAQPSTLTLTLTPHLTEPNPPVCSQHDIPLHQVTLLAAYGTSDL